MNATADARSSSAVASTTTHPRRPAPALPLLSTALHSRRRARALRSIALDDHVSSTTGAGYLLDDYHVLDDRLGLYLGRSRRLPHPRRVGSGSTVASTSYHILNRQASGPSSDQLASSKDSSEAATTSAAISTTSLLPGGLLRARSIQDVSSNVSFPGSSSLATPLRAFGRFLHQRPRIPDGLPSALEGLPSPLVRPSHRCQTPLLWAVKREAPGGLRASISDSPSDRFPS